MICFLSRSVFVVVNTHLLSFRERKGEVLSYTESLLLQPGEYKLSMDGFSSNFVRINYGCHVLYRNGCILEEDMFKGHWGSIK